MQVQKNKKKAQPKGKKNQKITQINNEEGEDQGTNNAAIQNGQSSSCCSSEDDSNASQELNGGAISSKSKGKSRASRGAATDPQSLYARVIINTSFISFTYCSLTCLEIQNVNKLRFLFATIAEKKRKDQ